jgi:para-aminobenzoate synthetase component 1
MGGLPYDLKRQFEPSLQETAGESISFSETAFFIPETVIYIPKGESYLYVEGVYPDWDHILRQPFFPAEQEDKPVFQSNFSKTEYINTVERLREHIAAGDFYEINLSQQYTADYQLQNPAALFHKLIQISPTPFSAFFRFDDKYLLCASPERFLQQKERQLLTQPIKGTAARGLTPAQDEENKSHLVSSIKERAENVMIVDLSRNDLYRSSEVNSVEVPHLFEIQTFPQVHQMVSSVTGTRREELNAFGVLANTFPAGSMTGAPKVRVMNAIDAYEGVQRGIYAGSVGYIQPNGDFDLNVVIRSLVYDDKAKKLSYQVGGAITYDSDPVAEYEETLIKARGIKKLFSF